MTRNSLDDLTAALTLREQSHRRAVLWGIAVLLILSTSPVFAHHLSLVDAYLQGSDHLGALCLTALHLLLAPVHYGFHVLLGLGLAYGLWDRWRAWRTGARALALLDAAAPTSSDLFWRAARVAGVDPRRLRLVRGLPSPALTVGLVQPRIYVAQELAAELTDDELSSVLAHEGAHVARRDPLRLSLLRLLACTLFWIPALRRLAEDMADEAEILADDSAARGRPLVLASAILRVAQGRAARELEGEVTPWAGFCHGHLLDRRIRRLVGEPAPACSHVTRRSLLGALAALSLAWTSGLLMAHPLPSSIAAHDTVHCEHHGESALRHLFCLGGPFAPLASDCPHSAGRSPRHLHA